MRCQSKDCCYKPMYSQSLMDQSCQGVPGYVLRLAEMLVPDSGEVVGAAAGNSRVDASIYAKVSNGAPERIRTSAPASGGRCSIP